MIRRFFRQKHESLQLELFSKHPEVFGGGGFDYLPFCWATGAVRSQMHPPMEGDRLALLPVVSHVRILSLMTPFSTFTVF